MGITTDIGFMQLAITQAKIAQSLGEVPVGCVIVKDGIVIASGYNRQIIDNDPTAHAEIVALKNAGKVVENHRLIDTTLYVSLEPCVMCFGAIIHARISKVVFATSDAKTGSCGGCADLGASACFNHKPQIIGGVLADECRELLQNFFRAKRKNNNQ